MIALARRAAHAALRRLHTQPLDVATALEHERRTLADERDRALATDIVLGALRWQAAIDHLIAWAGRRPIDRFDEDVLDVLRAAAYQVLYLDRVPAAAAVNDAVNLTKAIRRSSAASAVNAILRALVRHRHRLPLPGPDEGLDFLSITLSHPRWLVERWVTRLGEARARAWIDFNNGAPPLTLRANRLRAGRDALAADLRDHGIASEPTRFAPDGLHVQASLPRVAGLVPPERFIAQDESSQLVGAFVAASPGSLVLDTCAAPGTKTTQLACDVGASGLLVAADLRERRLRELGRTLARLGADARVLRVDLAAALPFGPIFDAVLVDAPCSSLGTLRRDPDVRWRRTPDDLVRYAAQQRRMVHEAARAVKPGGVLVYSTCSSEPDENAAVVDAFLGSATGFTIEDPRRHGCGVPHALHACLDERGCLRPEPDRHGLEPFFAVRLRRQID